MYSNIFDRISFLSLFLAVVLLPVFFLPFTNISIETGKGLFLVIGLIVSVIFWIVARFSDGKVNLPKSLCMLAGGGIVLVTLLSAIFSGASQISFFGTMFDVGTFWFIFSAFLLMLMSAIVFRDPRKARIVLFGIILSSTIVLVFQGLRLFIPEVLSLGIFAGKTDNILGSWNALGIFAGFYVISALFVIEFFPIAKILKLVLSALILLSIVFIALVNFVFIWEILGIFALLIFIYKLSVNSKQSQEQNQEEGKVHFPVLSFVIVLVALLFFTSGQFIGGILPNYLGISNNEVSPSFASTMSITKSVVKEHPVLGLGPNRFAEAWALYKPNAINATTFWDVSFNSGSGLLPTLISTTGLLGILAWFIFFVLFIFTGVRWLFSSIKNNLSFETVAFFFLSLYLFFASFFYFTGTVIILLAFVFAGVFIGLVASSRLGGKGEISLSFFNDHRKSFFFMLFLVLLTILSATIGFKYVQRFASVPYFTRTLTASSIEGAEVSIARAISLNSNDLYLRTYSQVYIVKLNSIISKGGSSLSDIDKANLQNALDQAINGAHLAIAYNPKNYLNFQMLGSVFETAGIIGVKEAYGRALQAYKTASTLNPGNPRLRLAMASVSLASGNTKEAKDYANQALVLKPDYIDALVILSQIAKSEGDFEAALSYAQTALSLSPTNQNLINYVNSLENPSPSGETSPSPTTSQVEE